MGQLDEVIIQHEGMRLKPYTDTTGHLTIGIGRNLDDNGISQDEAMYLFNNDLTSCESGLSSYSWYCSLDEVRQGVLIELTFNIGLSKVLQFVNMISALKNGAYSKAATELLSSKWATQVGQDRANNMARRLMSGTYA